MRRSQWWDTPSPTPLESWASSWPSPSRQRLWKVDYEAEAEGLREFGVTDVDLEAVTLVLEPPGRRQPDPVAALVHG